MPGNRIYIAKGTSVAFYRVDPVLNPKYNTVPWDYDWFATAIKPWETDIDYLQKWQLSDTTKLQLRANYEPVKVQIIDCVQRVYDTINFSKMPTAIVGQPTSVYEANIEWANYPEGIYYLLLTTGFGDLTQYMISEPQEVRILHQDTLLIEYSHSVNKGDIIFDTGIEFSLRVEAAIVDYQPGSEDTLYIDQPHNVVLLDSTPFEGYRLSLGGSFGIPDWVARKINYIFSCDSVKIDGVQYVKDQGAKMEANRITGYPLNGWSLDVSPAVNQDSAMFDDTFDDQVSVVYNIETDLFGELFPPGDGTIKIIDNQ